MKMKPIASALAAAGLGVAVLAGFAHAGKPLVLPTAATTVVAANQASPSVPTVAPSPGVALPISPRWSKSTVRPQERQRDRHDKTGAQQQIPGLDR
jgi:hypothetical protein